jgi:predicted glycosyltransferase
MPIHSFCALKARSPARRINCPILHTGFVAEAAKAEPLSFDQPLVLVSVGGGRIGGAVLDAAIGAAALLQRELPHDFRIFTGPFLPEEDFAKLQAKAAGQENVVLGRFTSNLLGHMQAADLSVSLAGYNTTMNVLRADVPAILVPIGHYDFDCEQLMRAEKLAELGVVDLLRQDAVSAESLAERIQSGLCRERVSHGFNLDGARDATEALVALQAQRTLPTRKGA